MPQVSVIVPTYNQASFVAATVESALAQTHPQVEVIVVENGSTDETSPIVERYPVRLFHNRERGPSPARNLGVVTSEADVVAFTDADCVADPHWLSELVKPYADPQVGGVGGAILVYAHPDRTLVEEFSERQAPLVNFVSGEDEFLPHIYTANASYRRDLLAQIGSFNPHMVTGEDVDLSWRLQLQTAARLQFAPQAIIYHHHRSTVKGLARQYRQYDFGEIVLDTMYGTYAGYPRNRRYQVRRILSQAAALPRYALSAILQQVRAAAGRTTPYQAAAPGLWFLIESSNIRGKLEALIAARFMRNAQPALNVDAQVLLGRFFPSHKD